MEQLGKLCKSAPSGLHLFGTPKRLEELMKMVADERDVPCSAKFKWNLSTGTLAVDLLLCTTKDMFLRIGEFALQVWEDTRLNETAPEKVDHETIMKDVEAIQAELERLADTGLPAHILPQVSIPFTQSPSLGAGTVLPHSSLPSAHGHVQGYTPPMRWHCPSPNMPYFPASPGYAPFSPALGHGQPGHASPSYHGQPGHASPSYQPGHTPPSYQPGHTPPSYQPGHASPSYQPGHTPPGYQPWSPMGKRD